MEFSKPATSAAIHGITPVSVRTLMLRKAGRIVSRGFSLAERCLETFFDLFIKVAIIFLCPFVCVFVIFIETLICPYRAEFRTYEDVVSTRRKKSPS